MKMRPKRVGDSGDERRPLRRYPSSPRRGGYRGVQAALQIERKRIAETFRKYRDVQNLIDGSAA